MSKVSTSAALVIAAAATTTVLMGCSSTASQPTNSPTSSATSSSPTSTQTSIPSNSSSPGTYMITMNTTEVRVKVGTVLEVGIPDIASVYTNNSKVLELYQPTTKNAAPYNGGAKVIGAGTATFTLNHRGGGVDPITVIATS